MEVTKVKDVYEAIILGLEWKNQGKYDWFRGQTHLWKIIPTIGRPYVYQEKVREKLYRFQFWLENTPGLEYLAHNADEAIAVAQHYGIPTSFVDFTTNPKIAGFFASYGNNLEIGQDCCIYCLNTKDLEKFWNSVCEEMTGYPKLEFLRLEVSGLWRLEAQEGVFLYCPIGVLEEFYPIDRIVFPYGGRYDIPIEEIYPVRKSHLEILLDQFFSVELRREGYERLQTLANKRNLKTFELSNDYDELDTYFFRDKLTILEFWKSENLHDWLSPQREQWKNTISKKHWEFEISIDKTASEIQTEIEETLYLRFESVKNFRRKLVDWSFKLEKTSSQINNANLEMQQTARRVFDGMRILPYTNEEIAKSISISLALTILWLMNGKDKWNSDWKSIFKPFIPDEIEIEIASLTGDSSRGLASRKRLFLSLRENLSELIRPEFREKFLGDIVPTIQFIIEPNKLYDFQKLRQVFVEDLIPTQSVIRAINSPVYFTPARLSLFGLA